MPILLTRRDHFGIIAQAGPMQMGADVGVLIAIGTNSSERSTAYLSPQDAYEFGTALRDLAVGSGAIPDEG